ncbi:DUF502 domain-containing protein [Shimia ponticola]|uniref:DUF502 domain-containing protein n=1 Tax=Shimia ponticola TaxID=2582893 RepID=UPI0011BECAD9|nr:DUF502 domain-containing protein [Shimia ponticola]
MATPFDKGPEPPRTSRFASLRSSFLTGLVVIAPIGLTAWLIWSVVGWIDGFVLPLIPDGYQPDILLRQLLGPWVRDLLGLEQVVLDDNFNPQSIRGIGVIVFLAFTLLVGWIAKGYIGRSLLRWAEGIVLTVPVVRSVYGGVKQIAETVFNQEDTSFEEAVLIEYPRKGIWAIGFISTNAKGEIAERNTADSDLMSVFVPTTPNPTSGFLLFFPEDDVVRLDMTVEDAAKLVISAGLVYPNGQPDADVRRGAKALPVKRKTPPAEAAE